MGRITGTPRSMPAYTYASISPLWRALSAALPGLAVAGDYNGFYYRPTA
jgi:hypothetical protein